MGNIPFAISTALIALSFLIPIVLLLVTLLNGQVEMSLVIGGLLVLQALAFAWLETRFRSKRQP